MSLLIFGLGLSGQACLTYFSRQGPVLAYNDTLTDEQKNAWTQRWPTVTFYDQAYPPTLTDVHEIIIMPGIPLTHPLCQQAQAQNIPIVSDIDYFARHARAPIIAITGTNGKSTTTKLVTDLLNSCGKKALMGGNIGVPVMSLLDEPVPEYYVLELSSFQLETTFSLKAFSAALLNISDDHLDRHGDLATYRAIKERIFIDAQHCIRPEDITQAQHEHPLASETLSPSLAGEHNHLNAQAALALLAPLNLDPTQLAQGLQNFVGLPHRCEVVGTSNQVTWINDSKATNVAATLAAITSLGPLCSANLLLLVGGVGKGQDFAPLQPAVKQHVDTTIAYGAEGTHLANLLNTPHAPGLRTAIAQAKALAQPGDWVLLSPACASFDEFKNYAERGQLFCEAIRSKSHDDTI